MDGLGQTSAIFFPSVDVFGSIPPRTNEFELYFSHLFQLAQSDEVSIPCLGDGSIGVNSLAAGIVVCYFCGFYY